MTARTLAFLFVGCLAAVSATASPEPAPRLAVQRLEDIAVPDRPYDESANADTAVAEAFSRARSQHKRVLIDLGGNWCGDCRVLAGIMELPELRRFLAAHYVIAAVDVGRFNRNLQIPARFGITQRLEGVPSVLIADPDGTLINRGHIAALADARHMTPQAIADWLAQWAS